MAGITIFHSLAEAVRHGFQIYDRTADGYIMRIRTENGWALALVVGTHSTI